MAYPKLVVTRDSSQTWQFPVWIPCSADNYGYWIRTEIGIPLIDNANMASLTSPNVRALRQIVIGRVHKGLFHSWNNGRITSEAGTVWSALTADASRGTYAGAYAKSTTSTSKNVFIGKLPAGCDVIILRIGGTTTGWTALEVYGDTTLLTTVDVHGTATAKVLSKYLTVTPSASDRTLYLKTPASAGNLVLYSVHCFSSTELAMPGEVDTAYFADGKWQGNDVIGYIATEYLFGSGGGKKPHCCDTWVDGGILASPNTLEPNVNFKPDIDGGAAGWCTLGYHNASSDPNRFVPDAAYLPTLWVDGVATYDLTVVSGGGGTLDWDVVVEADKLMMWTAGTNASATGNWFAFKDELDHSGITTQMDVRWGSEHSFPNANARLYGMCLSCSAPGGGSAVVQRIRQFGDTSEYLNTGTTLVEGSEWFIYVDGTPGYARVVTQGPNAALRTAGNNKFYSDLDFTLYPTIALATASTLTWSVASHLSVHPYADHLKHPRASVAQRI